VRALKLGYKNVFIMPEGIAGWEKAGLPVEKG
jgi:rhodanese-related sulfurtransferase